MTPADALEDARYPFEVNVDEMTVWVRRQSPNCLLHHEIGGCVGDGAVAFMYVFGRVTATGYADWVVWAIESCKRMVRDESRERGYCAKCEWWRESMPMGEKILALALKR